MLNAAVDASLEADLDLHVDRLPLQPRQHILDALAPERHPSTAPPSVRLYWIYGRVAAARRGQLALGHTLYLLSHLLVYLVGYLLIDDLCSGWLLVNIWHNVQYILFVWLHNRRRFAAGIDPQARALSWLSQPGPLRAALYVLASLAFVVPITYLLPRLGVRLDEQLLGVAVPTAITLGLALTFHHYMVDALIWKRAPRPAHGSTAPGA